MSDQLKHILIAFLIGIAACTMLVMTNIAPANWAPVITFAAAYFTHYYLENAPSGSPLIPGAPPTGPPATTVTPTATAPTPYSA
jgi:hypothetical protein